MNGDLRPKLYIIHQLQHRKFPQKAPNKAKTVCIQTSRSGNKLLVKSYMTLLGLSETIEWLGAFFSIHYGLVLPNSLSFVNNYNK